VAKDSNAYGEANYGYISVGNKLSAVLDRGNVILVFDTTYESSIDTNYTVYKKDLIGDGWQIDEFRVDSGTSISTFKTGIVSRYNANPTRIKQVVLIGNIKVPYSGNYNSTTLPPPDGHPQHNGAWPTDAYYGDIESSAWTDVSVSNSTGSRSANHNTVGDGKFDQSYLPGLQELSVGRIDMSELPAFTFSEADLMNTYFEKNHNYRHGNFPVVDSALLDYNFGTALGAEDFGANQCYRSMSPFYGFNSVKEVDYFSTLQNSYYKWAFGYGAGNYSSITGIGVTGNFASVGREVKSIFNVFFGSYFPDWDNSNNFLRAVIAPYGTSLISVAGGRPNLFFQSMATGKSIGYSIQESQNNIDTANSTSLFSFYFYGNRFITTSLMGDPTLRLDYINPVRNITFCRDSIQSDTMRIFWQAPLNETSIDSYYVYRGDEALDSFTLIGKTTDTFYSDTVRNKTQIIYYMVRASKLDSNCSGNYYNLSQGVCAVTEYMEKDSFSDTITICAGNSAEIGRNITSIEVSKGYTYTWTPNFNIINADTQKTIVHPSIDTLYILETKDKMGITAYDSFLVNIASVPSNGITVTNQSMSCGDTATLISNPSPNGSFTYSWTFNNATPGSIVGTNFNGPHTVIYSVAGTQKVNLDILYNSGTCLYKDSLGVVINCITLPVELISFTADKKENFVDLNWVTSTEINNNYFEILRSEDGLNWTSLDSVISKAIAGNSFKILKYNYLDRTRIASGLVYYKLVQYDFNGDSMESQVAVVKLIPKTTINPNPFKGELFFSNFKQINKIELYTYEGKLMYSERNPSNRIDTRFLKKGVYFIQLNLKNEIITERVLKQ